MVTSARSNITSGATTWFLSAALRMISSASWILPWESSQRGDSGTYLQVFQYVNRITGIANLIWYTYHQIFFPRYQANTISGKKMSIKKVFSQLRMLGLKIYIPYIHQNSIFRLACCWGRLRLDQNDLEGN